MSEIEFTTAPPPKPTRAPWRKPIIDALQERPGEWAIVKRADHWKKINPYASVLRQHGAEATCRRLSDNEIALYARWPETQGES